MLKLRYFLLGFVGLGGQVLLLRRAMATFGGNEMTVATLLAAWTAWTSIGSMFGGRFATEGHEAESRFSAGLESYLWLLFITYFMAYLAKHVSGVGMGEAVGPLKTIAMSFVLVGPLCFVLGALFPVAAVLAGREAGAAVGRTYLWESLGAAAGGISTSAVIVPFFNPGSSVVILILLACLCMAAISRGMIRWVWVITSLVSLALLLFFSLQNIDLLLSKWRWGKRPVHAQWDSRYASLTLLEREGEFTLFVNGMPEITWPGGAPAEELAHIAMLSHPAPRRVLLVSGGLASLGAEILKYPVERLDYCQIDPGVIGMEKLVKQEAFSNPRVRLHIADCRQFLKKSNEGAFDVIILSAGEPGSLAANRYFSREMFREASRALASPGIIAFATGEYANYIEPLMVRYLASIRATLVENFESIEIYPLGRYCFVAGKGVKLPKDGVEIADIFSRSGVNTRWFKPEVFIANLEPRRMEAARKAVQGVADAEINSDFHPQGYALFTAWWSTLFSEAERNAMEKLLALSFFPALCIALLLAITGAVSTLLLKRLGLLFAVSAMGFGEMVISVSVLYAAQVRLGSLYSLMGYFLTALMVGLSVGAWVVVRFFRRRHKIVFGVFIFIFACFIFALNHLQQGVLPILSDTGAIILLSLMAIIGSGLSGAIYALAARVGEQAGLGTGAVAGRINAADLIGSAMGALLAGTILFPVWGFAAAFAITGLIVAGGLVCWLLGGHVLGRSP